jgi:hypothetical protein
VEELRFWPPVGARPAADHAAAAAAGPDVAGEAVFELEAGELRFLLPANARTAADHAAAAATQPGSAGEAADELVAANELRFSPPAVVRLAANHAAAAAAGPVGAGETAVELLKRESSASCCPSARGWRPTTPPPPRHSRAARAARESSWSWVGGSSPREEAKPRRRPRYARCAAAPPLATTARPDSRPPYRVHHPRRRHRGGLSRGSSARAAVLGGPGAKRASADPAADPATDSYDARRAAAEAAATDPLFRRPPPPPTSAWRSELRALPPPRARSARACSLLESCRCPLHAPTRRCRRRSPMLPPTALVSSGLRSLRLRRTRATQLRCNQRRSRRRGRRRCARARLAHAAPLPRLRPRPADQPPRVQPRRHLHGGLPARASALDGLETMRASDDPRDHAANRPSAPYCTRLLGATRTRASPRRCRRFPIAACAGLPPPLAPPARGYAHAPAEAATDLCAHPLGARLLARYRCLRNQGSRTHCAASGAIPLSS